MSAPIALLTDFGTSDVYVGVMKCVISGIAPDSTLIDLGHQIPPQDVRAAASSLLFAHAYLPAGAVICCVVDPGVGTERKALALELESAAGITFLVCPDNGVVTPLLDRLRRAVVLDDPAFRLTTVSSTFHGRDIFAPASAHLAAGVALERLGNATERQSLVTIEWPIPVPHNSVWLATVIHVDRFGNLITNMEGARLENADWLVSLGQRTVRGVSSTFGTVAVGQPVAYVGSSGFLELAVRQGSAAAEWGAAVGDAVVVERKE